MRQLVPAALVRPGFRLPDCTHAALSLSRKVFRMMPPVDPFMGSSYRGGDPEHKTSCPAEEETAGGMQLFFAGQSSRGEGTQHSANSQTN